MVRSIPVVMIAWILHAGMVFAEDQFSGRVQGTIASTDGQALPGASISVSGAGLPRPTGTTADKGGNYIVFGLPSGTLAITVSHIGFRSYTSAVDLGAGDFALTLNVVLKPAALYLERNVVTASRTREKALDAPASIATVDGETIRDNPALTISDHVRDLPGVDFSQTGLVQSNVVVRGFNNVFSGALMAMTDNRIARVPSLRLNAYNFVPIINEDIERIEVVLGPGSALYGPNSANGVMHVITTSPFNSAGTTVQMGMGERSLRKAAFRHAGSVSPHIAYKISGQYYTGTDWKYDDPVEVSARAADPTLKARDYDIQRQGLEARVDFRPNADLTGILTYGYNLGDHIEMTGLGSGQVIDWNYNYAQARVIYRDLFIQYYRNWNDAGDTFVLATGDPIVDKSSLDVFQVQHVTQLNPRQRFTYGADLLLTRPDTKGTINGQNESDDDINEYGVYLQSETDLTPDLDLVLALRYDDHNRIEDGVLSPRAGLVYTPQENQTVRLTYNRAFATPTTTELYLDRRARSDPYTLASNFGVEPIDVRAQGTFRDGFDEGFTFKRSDDGRPMFRTPFSPFIADALQARGLAPGDPDYSIDGEGYISLADPIATAVLWGVGREAVIAGVVPAMQGAGPLLGLTDEQIAALGPGLQAFVPAQLPSLGLDMRTLNLETEGFDAADDVVNVPRTKPTTTQTLEVGYKGIIGGNLVVAADVYRTEREDFVGPLAIETPNVFLDATLLQAALTQAFENNMQDANFAEFAAVLAQVDNPLLGLGGDGDGDPVPELAHIFTNGAEIGGEARPGAAGIPYGTVSPLQAYDHDDVIVTYRNFGDVTLYGLDLSAGFYPNEVWSLTGNYSFVDDSFFENLGGIADVALNAPQHKLKLGGTYRIPEWSLRLRGQARYAGSFRMRSGVFEGDVDSYTVVDASGVYDIPYGEGLSLTVSIDNLLANKYRSFVGAPEIGRMTYAQLGLTF